MRHFFSFLQINSININFVHFDIIPKVQRTSYLQNAKHAQRVPKAHKREGCKHFGDKHAVSDSKIYSFEIISVFLRGLRSFIAFVDI